MNTDASKGTTAKVTKEPNLDSRGVDRTVVGLKGVLGAIPVVGSLVSELVGAFIPNQRLDRIADFTQKLASKIDAQSQILIQNRFLEPEGADIVEEALWQTARALSDERRERIASLVKNALSKEDINLVESKKLLLLLSQLNDFELLLLRSYAEPFGKETDFTRAHEEELQPVHAYYRAPKELLDKHAIRKSMDDHLKELGLISPSFSYHGRGQLTEFDLDTGTLKPSHHYISLLGRLLLREIDFYPENDTFYNRDSTPPKT